jgi:predicted PurR-regulated permease PerM
MRITGCGLNRCCRANLRARNWLMGQGMLMVTFGLSSFVAFAVLWVKYFYSLSVLKGSVETGLANIVPVIGAPVTIMLSSAVAAIDSTAQTYRRGDLLRCLYAV